jgi:hypothetical protein
MTKKRATQKPEDAATDAGRVFYVYCAGAREEVAPLLVDAPGAIEEGAHVEAVGRGALAAVVSAVPAEDYGAESFESRLMTDAEWTAARAMRHERVVEHFAARATVVPLRFGTIYLRRERVERMLAEKESELESVLARLRGREEWGVNVYCDRARLKESIAEVSPRLRELAAQASRASPGQGYLLRKKIDALRDDETRAEIRRAAAEIESALAAVSEGSARLRVLKSEAGEHGETAAKLAFLVAREAFADFRSTAERLAEARLARGFRLELTGPWPAYNFVGVVSDE